MLFQIDFFLWMLLIVHRVKYLHDSLYWNLFLNLSLLDSAQLSIDFYNFL